MFSKKYRPRRFSDLIGQEGNTIILKEILKRGVVLPMIFTGPFGSGKTSASRVFAKAVLCKNRSEDQEPCCKCSSCIDFEKDQNINYYEIDAASNGDVDSIRDLREQVNYQAVGSRYKVTNIDEAHNITKQGYNALLKILEEGVAHHIFIFCTNEPEKMLETVRSRCWRIHSSPVKPQQLKEHLQKIASLENLTVREGALELLAKVTAPHIRDALNVMEFLSFNNRIEKHDVEDYFHLSETRAVLQIIDSIDDPARVIRLLEDLAEKMDITTVFDRILATLLDLESIRVQGRSPDSFLFSEDMERVAQTDRDFLAISQLLIRVEKPVDANFLKHLLLEASRLVRGIKFEQPVERVIEAPQDDFLFSKIDVPSIESMVLNSPSSDVKPPPFSSSVKEKSVKQGFHYEGGSDEVQVKHESNIDLSNYENYKLLRKKKENSISTSDNLKTKKQKTTDPLSEPVSFDTAERYLKDKNR